MKNLGNLRSSCPILGASLLLLALAPSVFAQQGPGPPQIDRRVNPERARQQDMSKREWQLRNPGPPPEAPPDRRQLKALMAQTEEDFNRILTLHNKIGRIASTDHVLDYNFVLEATAEIKKRARRLQNTLALRYSEEAKENPEKLEEISEPQIKDMLIKLCKEIRSFVTNPVIENPGTVHPEHLSTARRDLADVIRLSAEISNYADRLHRTTR